VSDPVIQLLRPERPVRPFSTNSGSGSSAVGVLMRVSVATDGTQANGASDSYSVSATGRFIAFGSSASNLVAGDTNGVYDVFLRDTCIGAPADCVSTTIRVSIANDGSEGNGATSSTPSLSADGRYVAFSSGASNLVSGDTNGKFDTFVRDTCIGAAVGCVPSTSRVSVATDGSEANNGGSGPQISATGRFIAFMSSATNLVAADTNAAIDSFLRDTCLGAPAGCVPSTIRVSVASDGSQATGGTNSVPVAVTSDGRFVLFDSAMTSLTGIPNSLQALVRDTCIDAPSGCTPSTTLVAASVTGGAPDGETLPVSITADGSFVAFYSWADNLVPNDTNAIQGMYVYDVFVRDMCTGAPVGCSPTTVRVSILDNGDQVTSTSRGGFMTPDARYVAMSTIATTVSPLGTTGFADAFVREACVGQWSTGCTPHMVKVSVGPGGVQGNGDSDAPKLSADGHYAVFSSTASNLVAGDTNGVKDIFIAATGKP
jgi:Tol biopolymer transport system component